MESEERGGLALLVSDASQQKMANVRDVPPDASVGELVQGLLESLRLPKQDASGRPLSYWARLDREGRHLGSSELVREALQPGDHLILSPNIDAGRGVR
jgi:hypothetical protein